MAANDGRIPQGTILVALALLGIIMAMTFDQIATLRAAVKTLRDKVEQLAAGPRNPGPYCEIEATQKTALCTLSGTVRYRITMATGSMERIDP